MSGLEISVTNIFVSTKPNHGLSWRHARSDSATGTSWILFSLEDPFLTVSSVCAATTALNATPTTLWWVGRQALNLSIKGRQRINTALTFDQVSFFRKTKKKRLIAGYNTARRAIPDLHEGFADSIEEVLRDFSTSSAGENYHIRFAIYNSAMDAVGKKKRQSTNCLQTAVKLALPKARASDRNFRKRAAVLDYKREPSDKTLTYCTQEGQEVDAQMIACRLANDYWLCLC